MVSAIRQRLKYVIGDYLASNVAVCAYNIIRYYFGEDIISGQGYSGLIPFMSSQMVVLGQVVFPIAMMGVYYLSGYYKEIYRKSRLQEFITTLFSGFISTLIIFFVAAINDLVSERAYNYELIIILWGILFLCVYVVRMTLTNIVKLNISRKKWEFNTIIVGSGKNAADFDKKLGRMNWCLGYKIVGYCNIPGEVVSKHLTLPVYELEDLAKVCEEQDIKELIVVPSKRSARTIINAIDKLFTLNLPIKITPDIYSVLLSKVRLSNIYGEPLVDVSGVNMSASGENLKRMFDVILSVIGLVLLLPFSLIISIMIKMESKGKIIYKQERIGYRNKSFMIYKFRTMVEDAEKDGQPQLSSDEDERITKWGRFMRKYRIDELPQLWNVLKGDMSMVGPRPERQYYINEIVKRAPFYALLHQVRPGITSMGMVKYGYAKTVDEMIERMKYDLLYIENMSLLNDMKIMIYTIDTVLTGKGI